jgi:flagellar motility protein MotE (MotC chaperone)
MKRFVRDLRLIPIAVVACVCLLLLKAADLMLGASESPPRDSTSIIRTTADVPPPSGANVSWATEMFNFPGGKGSAPAPLLEPIPADKANADIITGSVPSPPAGEAKPPAGEEKPDAKGEGKAAAVTPPATTFPRGAETKPKGTVIPLDNAGPVSSAERALLERLQQRREELDTRSRELDIRETLVKAAEKRLETQLTALKEVKAQIASATQQQDDAETARFKGLVSMYQNMKPRDAAKIFNGLDMGVLLQVAGQINPRNMADIMAQMAPEAAQKLTVELASKAEHPKAGTNPNDLPKIDGTPTTQ